MATGRQATLLDRSPRGLRIVPPGAACFLPEGFQVAFWGDDKGVELWDGRSTTTKRLRGGPADWVLTLALSPDGRMIAAMCAKDSPEDTWKVHLYERASGREIRCFVGHQGWVTCLAFGAGGRVLFSGSKDGTVLAWDTTGQLEGGKLKPAKLTEEEAKGLWDALAGEDAAEAQRAVWLLASDPGRSVPLLRKHLLATAAEDSTQPLKLVADLDSPRFAVREGHRRTQGGRPVHRACAGTGGAASRR